MAYTTLPSLTSWWHNLQKQRSTGPDKAACRCHFKSIRPATHARTTSTAASASSSHYSCSVKSRRRDSKGLGAKLNKQRHNRCQSSLGSDSSGSLGVGVDSVDTNQLQTALNQAIAAEDYTLASKFRDQIQTLVGSSGTADWRQLGVPEWLADRIERMGYKYATGTGFDTCLHAAHLLHCWKCCSYCRRLLALKRATAVVSLPPAFHV